MIIKGIKIKISRKIIIIAAVGILLLGSIGYVGAINGWFGGGAAIPEDTMTRGLVGYWNMDEGGGQTAKDLSGNGNNGTLGANSSAGADDPKWTKGKKGNALKFDGVNDYVDAGNAASLNITNAITIEGWAKLSGLAAFQDIASKGGIYRLNKENNYWRAWVTIGGASKSVPGTTVIQSNVWYHVVSTYNGINLNIYVNGVLENTLATTGSIDINAAPLTIGSFNGTLYNFSGSIDDVRIYNRALSAAEVRYHYNHGGPVAEWKFDEGSGTKAYDSTENNNNGTLTNFSSTNTGTATSGANNTLTDTGRAWTVNQWTNGTITITAGTGSGQTKTISSNTATIITITSNWTINPDATSVYSLVQAPAWTTGKEGTALQFDGKDDYVDAGNSPNFQLATYSWSMWIKGNSAPGTLTTTQPLWNADQRFQFNWDHGTAGFKQSAAHKSGGIWYKSQIKSSLSANTWYYVAATYDGINIRIYLNGILEDTNAAPAPNSVADSLRIGSSTAGGAGYFSGFIDSVRIYNYARTLDEIQLDYNGGLTTHLGPTGKSCAQDPASCVNNGLVGYWNMDEGGGQIAKDLSGNGNNGTLINGPLWTKGKKGNALKFDGKNDYVNAGNGASLDFGTGSFAVEFWMKPSTVTANQQVINKAPDNFLTGWGITIQSGMLYGYFPGNVEDISYAISSNTWAHWVFIRDSLGNLSLYKNGTSVATGFSAVNLTVTDNLEIGARTHGSYSWYFNGSIDEVRIYNRALSAEEVRYQYNKGGPVAEWKFDEGSGQKAYDSTDNNNDGWLGGTSAVQTSDPTWVSGKEGGALSFDGTDDYIEVPETNTSLDITGAVTVEAWVKPNVSSFSGYAGLIRKGLTTSDRPNNFMLQGRSGNLGLQLTYSHASNNNEYLNSSRSLSQGIYSYVVGIINPSAQLMSIYINGVLDSSNPISTESITPNDYPLWIGSVSSIDRFPGTIDDVRIYNYARTPDEIQLDYNGGLANHLGPTGKTCGQDPASCVNNGLVGYWNMDEGGGQTAKDLSNNGNNGTLGTGSGADVSDPKWVKGSSPAGGGSALKFDGKDDYVELVKTDTFDSLSQGTIMAWIKAGPDNKWDTIFSTGYAGCGSSLEFAKGDGTPNNIEFWGAADCITTTLNGWMYVSNLADRWHHVAYVSSSSGNKFYFDGVEGAEGVYQAFGDIEYGTGSASTPFFFSNAAASGTNRYVIGQSVDAPAESFPGSIDEVRIYNRPLSKEEINYHYNKGRPVAEWKFDESTGQKAYDSMGNNDGWLGGTSAVEASDPAWVAGKYGGALSFDGTNDYVKKTNITGIPSITPLSIEFWAKPDTFSSGWHDLFKKSGSWAIQATNTGNLNFEITGWQDATSDVIMPLDLWTHFAVTADGAIIKYYKNGSLADTITQSYTPNVGTPDIYIGSNDSSGEYYDGSIDEIKIYSRALSADEILKDYNAGVATRFK